MYELHTYLLTSYGMKPLIHCGLVMSYGDRELTQHWLRWWLVMWQYQATRTHVDLSSVRSSNNHMSVISQEILQPSITKINLKTNHLKLQSPPPPPPGSAFIKPDQVDPGIKDQIKITLLPTISHLRLLNFVSCGRACPSHMTQNLVTVGAKLWTAECFLFDPWSMDQADLVW